MGREVRMVPPDWKHPKNGARYKPLHPGNAYKADVADFMDTVASKGLQAAIDWCGCPDKHDYMPEWTPEEATHYMMYEDTSEGTPISPAFATPEELARWLADTGASSFGDCTATYDQWLATIKRGWAPSAVITNKGFQSGVEAGD